MKRVRSTDFWNIISREEFGHGRQIFTEPIRYYWRGNYRHLLHIEHRGPTPIELSEGKTELTLCRGADYRGTNGSGSARECKHRKDRGSKLHDVQFRFAWSRGQQVSKTVLPDNWNHDRSLHDYRRACEGRLGDIQGDRNARDGKNGGNLHAGGWQLNSGLRSLDPKDDGHRHRG